MNANSKTSSRSGITHLDLLVIIGVLVILAAVLLLDLASSKRRVQSINCINNLKQSCLAFKMSIGDGDSYPMDEPAANGGTKEFVTGADTFRHFQVLSNELNTPKILVCPSDTRIAATNFVMLNNQNVSYFVDLDAAEAYPERILAGDRNITADNAPVKGILKLVPSQRVGWTKAMHVNQGNISFTDGSVQLCSDSAVQTALQKSGSPTNTWRISLPE
jgi:prepilin-type processing-associated H-X9-DG protein